MSAAQATRARHTRTRDDTDRAEKAPRARNDRAGDDSDPEEQADAAPGRLSTFRRFLLTWALAAFARAKHALLVNAAAVLDSGIASLQRLRQLAGGAQDTVDGSEHDRHRPGKRRPGERRDTEPDTPTPVAPRKRRLRSLLVYLSVMLVGGMAGMVLAYDLLAQLLDRRATAISRQEIKLSKYSKSMAEYKKKLEREQAQRIEAEARLAAGAAEYEKKLIDQQTKRAQAENQLATVLAEHAKNVPRREAGGGRGTARSGLQSPARSANCTLRGSNIRSAVIGCVDELNRR